MTAKFYIILFIFLFGISDTFPQEIDLRAKLDKDVFQQWDSYIKKYAPADSAFKVVVTLANRHYYARRSAVSRQVYLQYYNLFPDKKALLDTVIENHTEIMLTQKPDLDIKYIYAKYAEVNADTDNGLIAVKRLAEDYLDRKDWDSSAYVFKFFLDTYPSKRKEIEEIIKIIEAPDDSLVVKNIGTTVNSTSSEWDPTPSPDGRYLFFSSNRRKGSHGKDDVWFSENINGEWSAPKNIGSKINGINDETIDNISVDGNTVLLSGSFDGTFGKFDIYTATVDEFGWAGLEHPPYPINTEFTDESANLTPDGKALIFTSDRPGGVGEFIPFNSIRHGGMNGNFDIYISFITDSGWSKAINLGKTINTPFAERSCFLHPDGKTLYFSSNGHPGLGGLDVFKSVRLYDDSWTEWSKPINLGKEINSAKDEWGYVINLKGDKAYFASQQQKDNYGGWDIYTITVPDSAKPNQVFTIKGRVHDSDGRPMIAKIKWEDLETGEVIGTLQTNPTNGRYFIVLPLGKNYGYYAQKKNYYPVSNNIDLRGVNAGDEITVDIELYSLKDLRESKPLVINNIFFEFDKFELLPESFPELNRLAEFLREHEYYNIIIEGYTDNIGTEEYNKLLSEKRAYAVKKYLTNKDLDAKRFKIEGYGADSPIADNQDPESRAKNRRVQIRFER